MNFDNEKIQSKYWMALNTKPKLVLLEQQSPKYKRQLAIRELFMQVSFPKVQEEVF